MPRQRTFRNPLIDLKSKFELAGGPSSGPRRHGPYVGPMRDMTLGTGSGGNGIKISGKATRLPSHLINLGTGRPKSDEYMDAYTPGTAKDTGGGGGGGGGGGLESYTDDANRFFRFFALVGPCLWVLA